MPIAAGIALAKQIQGSAGRVVTLIGDGEANEGTIWETALLAAHRHLKNLVCIVDYNHSTDRALALGSIAGKFAAFGWDVVEIDGHNPNEIEESLSLGKTTKPLAIIANTIKGKGVKVMENNPAWHHAAPKMNELENLLGEIS
jgi:transketolase